MLLSVLCPFSTGVSSRLMQDLSVAGLKALPSTAYAAVRACISAGRIDLARDVAEEYKANKVM